MPTRLAPAIVVAACATTVLLSLKCASSAEPGARSAKAPMVVLALSSREFEVGDPLFARVTLINGTTQPVSLSTKFSAQAGLVQFRTRKTDGEWETIQAYGQGRASPRNAESFLAVGESLATIEVIFLVGDIPVFAEPGEFAIQAVVRCPPVEYLSAPVTVAVKSSSSKQSAFLKAHGAGLSEQLRGGPSRVPYGFPMADLHELPDSLLRRQLLEDHVFYQWAVEAKGMVDGAEWRELQELLPKLDQVNLDRFNLNIAVTHYKNRRYHAALAALDPLPAPTPASVWFRGEINRASSEPGAAPPE